VIVVGDAAGGVDDEDHRVSGVDRRLGLSADGCGEGLAGGQLPAAGVDEEELPPRPVGEELPAITRDTGPLLGDGGTATDDPVDEGGLADVGTADDGDDGEATHAGSSVGPILGPSRRALTSS